MPETKERYFVRVSGLSWQECTKEKWISAERSAGFRSKFGDDTCATGGFSAHGIEGARTYDGKDPDGKD